jgi:hypothetical protein
MEKNTLKIKLSKILKPILASMIIPLIILVVIIYMTKSWLYILLFLPAAVIIVCCNLHLFKVKVGMDKNQIKVSSRKITIILNWQQIDAIKLSKYDKQYYLLLASSEKLWSLPLYYIDGRELVQRIKIYAKPSALEEDAFEKLYQSEEWIENQKKAQENIEKPATVKDYPLAEIIGWTCMAAFIFLTISALYDKELAMSMFFAVLVLLTPLIIIPGGQSQIDREYITRKNKLGIYKIKWDEVREVQLSPNRDKIIFIGENKQLVIKGPTQWGNGDGEKFFRILINQIKARQIKTSYTMKAIFKRTKNCRIGFKQE